MGEEDTMVAPEGGGGGGLPVWAIWTIVSVVLVIIVAVVVVVLVVGGGGTPNTDPTVSSLIANPPTVGPSGSSTLTCTATDVDGDPLTYTWSATGGSISGTGSTVTWVAPAAENTYTITVEVADGRGGTDTDSVNIEVAVGNTAPVITSVVAADPSVLPGGSTTVTCTATDADGDTLTYTWSAPDGGSFSGTGNSVTWHAPAGEDTYTIAVTVSDGNGGTDSASTNVVVALVATTGSIDIQSNPAGAKVYLDGVDTGNITPYVLTGVSAGNHAIRLTAMYRKDRQQTVAVVAGDTTYINWALDSAPPQSDTLQPDAAGKDSYIYEGAPASNRGGETQVCAAGNTGSNCRLFIEYDLSSIPSTAVITLARLDLYYHSNAGGAIEGPVGAYRIIQSWDEGTITWNNQPNTVAAATDIELIPAAATNNFRNWAITDLVQGWVEGSMANYGVMLADTDESSNELYKCFRSSDHGTAGERPRLIIQYYDPAP
jgi:hypothetical protein